MRVRRTQDYGVQRGLGRNIRNIPPGPAQERIIFLAREWLAESELHRHLPPQISRFAIERSAGRGCGGGPGAALASAKRHRTLA